MTTACEEAKRTSVCVWHEASNATMTSTEHRIQAEAETRSPEGLQQRSKASAGSGGRNGLRAPNFNCDNVRVNVCASSNESRT